MADVARALAASVQAAAQSQAASESILLQGQPMVDSAAQPRPDQAGTSLGADQPRQDAQLPPPQPTAAAAPTTAQQGEQPQ
eukprot:7999213-Alexandrium_andersonii.AAC.1